MQTPISQEALKLIIPEDILSCFELTKIKEFKERIELTLTEKQELIPPSLLNKQAVLNGYWNPLELQTFPLKGKSCYLKLLRRKWKEPGGVKSYGNSYQFDTEGTKATREFGAFLKEYLR
jgi:hypothetical protein